MDFDFENSFYRVYLENLPFFVPKNPDFSGDWLSIKSFENGWTSILKIVFTKDSILITLPFSVAGLNTVYT